jgi:hypothetical protein
MQPLIGFDPEHSVGSAPQKANSIGGSECAKRSFFQPSASERSRADYITEKGLLSVDAQGIDRGCQPVPELTQFSLSFLWFRGFH